MINSSKQQNHVYSMTSSKAMLNIGLAIKGLILGLSLISCLALSSCTTQSSSVVKSQSIVDPTLTTMKLTVYEFTKKYNQAIDNSKFAITKLTFEENATSDFAGLKLANDIVFMLNKDHSSNQIKLITVLQDNNKSSQEINKSLFLVTAKSIDVLNNETGSTMTAKTLEDLANTAIKNHSEEQATVISGINVTFNTMYSEQNSAKGYSYKLTAK